MLLREKILQIDLTPFGGILRYDDWKSPDKGLKGLWAAAAGPLANYLAVLVTASYAPIQGHTWMLIAQETAKANLVMLCVNMLPVFPLDGGRMLFSVGYYLLPAGRLISLLTNLGIAAGGSMILFAIYGLIHYQILNFSYILVGTYLAVYAWRSREVLLTENMYTVVHERLGASAPMCRVAIYRIPEHSHLTSLLLPMERAESAVFVFNDGDKECWLSDSQIYRMLLLDPRQTVAQAYDCLHAIQEKPQNKKNL